MVDLDYLDDKILADILELPKFSSLSFTKHPQDKQLWKELNQKVFSVRKDIRLEFTERHGLGTWADIVFLRDVTEVERLSIYEFDLQSLEPISDIRNLKEFIIRCNPNTSLNPIKGFKNLSELTLIFVNNDIDVVSDLEGLQVLSLFYLTMDNLDLLLNLRNLKKMYISGEGFTNIDAIGEIDSIDFLYLANLQSLRNINFIKKIRNLIKLQLLHIPITRLPDLKELDSLESIEIERMDILKNIDGIKNLKGLKEFLCYEMDDKIFHKIRRVLEKKNIKINFIDDTDIKLRKIEDLDN